MAPAPASRQPPMVRTLPGPRPQSSPLTPAVPKHFPSSDPRNLSVGLEKLTPALTASSTIPSSSSIANASTSKSHGTSDSMSRLSSRQRHSSSSAPRILSHAPAAQATSNVGLSRHDSLPVRPMVLTTQVPPAADNDNEVWNVIASLRDQQKENKEENDELRGRFEQQSKTHQVEIACINRTLCDLQTFSGQQQEQIETLLTTTQQQASRITYLEKQTTSLEKAVHNLQQSVGEQSAGPLRSLISLAKYDSETAPLLHTLRESLNRFAHSRNAFLMCFAVRSHVWETICFPALSDSEPSSRLTTCLVALLTEFTGLNVLSCNLLAGIIPLPLFLPFLLTRL